jgi:hypothetical protein
MMMRRLSLIALVALAACSQAEPEPAAKALTEAPAAPAEIPGGDQGLCRGRADRLGERRGGDAGGDDPADRAERAGRGDGRAGGRDARVALDDRSGRDRHGPADLAERGGGSGTRASGERATELDTALKAALATDPAATLRVLEVARQRLSPATVCAGDARTTGLLKPAVETVVDPALEAKKTACLAAMG